MERLLTEEHLEDDAKRKGLRGTFGSAREAIGDSIDKVSGTAFRRQFEQFVNVVETTAVGIHRDQQKLNKRIEKLENSTPVRASSPPTHKMLMAAFIFSLIAAILATSALVVVMFR